MNGAVSASISSYRISLNFRQQVATADPHDSYAQINYGIGLGLLGNALAWSGNDGEDLNLLTQGIEVQQSHATRRADAPVQRFIALNLLLLGQVLDRLGRHFETMADYTKAAAIYAKADGTDRQATIALAGVYVDMAKASLAQKNVATASERYDQAIALPEPVMKAANPPMDALHIAADAYWGEGELLLRHDTAARPIPVAGRIEILRQACSWFDRSGSTWRKVIHPGFFTSTGFQTDGPAKVFTSLKRCNAALQALSGNRMGVSNAAATGAQ
jgi:tetratricopeptide (TPR) repeat protein